MKGIDDLVDAIETAWRPSAPLDTPAFLQALEQRRLLAARWSAARSGALLVASLLLFSWWATRLATPPPQHSWLAGTSLASPSETLLPAELTVLSEHFLEEP